MLAWAHSVRVSASVVAPGRRRTKATGRWPSSGRTRRPRRRRGPPSAARGASPPRRGRRSSLHLDHVLVAAQEVQAAVLVEEAVVTGVQPTAAELAGGGLRGVPVAAHHGGPRTRISPTSPKGQGSPVVKETTAM